MASLPKGMTVMMLVAVDQREVLFANAPL